MFEQDFLPKDKAGYVQWHGTLKTGITEPQITGPKANGRVELDFPKGKSKGVNIYTKRGAETAYTFLARDTEAPYVGSRALLVPGQPETRTYRATYVGPGDEEVGDPGNDLTITAKP